MVWEDLFRFSINHAMEMILIFNKKGEIIYANESAKNNISSTQELAGWQITNIFPDCFQNTEEGLTIKCNVGEEMQELIAYRENRTCFSFWGKITSCAEVPDLFFCMGYDISEKNLLEKKLQQAEQEVQEASKIKSEFVANITHELRTPVNGIWGNIKELKATETDDKKLRLLSLVEHGCKNMNAIIDNILDFSKLESGKFSLELRKFNFYQMLEFVKSTHANKIVEKGLEFLVNVSPEIPEYIVGDELRIVQVLNNLLSNACKFTHVGKIVLEIVKTAQYDNRVELFFMVIDSGIGIDKADQEKLFHSFSQVDASITRKYGGTGLGLNICKQLVELMDGGIRVESAPNKGSIFSFHIWVEIPPEEVKETVESANTDMDSIVEKLKHLSEKSTDENIRKYGEPENLEELHKKMSKLILCIEMDNWEKAEMFAETIKQLTEEAPKEIKTAFLRMKMAVQKEDYQKSVTAFETFNSLLTEKGKTYDR